MPTFDVKKNKAICVLPWVHQYAGTQGKTAPCCYARKYKQDENIESVRTQMLKGERPRVCETCYHRESESNFSERIQETNRWINRHGEPDIHNPVVQSIDMRYDATCNLKCKICGPHDSTLWQKELGIRYPMSESRRQAFLEVDKSKLKRVYLAGGEPTYIKDYIDFLEELIEVNPDCEITLTSNLKKLPPRWRALFEKAPQISVTCSCDATGLLGSYVRYPLDWQEFQDNVKFVMSTVKLQFNIVASNISAHRLHETCTWMHKHTNNIILTPIHQPEIFTERAVPHNVRHLYIDQLDLLAKFPVSAANASLFRTQARWLRDRYLNSGYDETLHLALRQEITRQDAKRTLQITEVDTFLADWIYR